MMWYEAYGISKPYYADDAVCIVHADCRDILGQIPNNSLDMLLTSPPYPGNNKMWGDLFKDDNVLEAHEYLYEVWGRSVQSLKSGCKIAINVANTKRRPYIPNTYYTYRYFLEKLPFQFKGEVEPLGEIIWNKGYGQVGTAWGSFRSPSDPSLADQHEYILIFRKDGNRYTPDAYEKIPTHDFKSWRNSIWNIPPAKASEEHHIAPFPEELANRLIILYTFSAEVVLDPFLGSGTTAYCAKKLGRKCIGTEIEEKFCEVAANRCRQMVLPMEVSSAIQSGQRGWYL